MRIKKKASILMISAAAVATVGVGAVSFAAWTGENDNIRASAAAGSAYLFGFTEVQTDPLELGTLVPHDQTTGIINGTNFVSVALPEYSVVGNYTIKVECSTGGNAKNLDFYAFVGDEVTAVPDGWFDAANKQGWKRVSDDATFEFNVAAPGTTVNADTMYVSLMLVSSDPEQMDAAADFDITLTTVTTNA